MGGGSWIVRETPGVDPGMLAVAACHQVEMAA